MTADGVIAKESSALSKPNLASKYSLESSRRDLHNALLCTVLESEVEKRGGKRTLLAQNNPPCRKLPSSGAASPDWVPFGPFSRFVSAASFRIWSRDADLRTPPRFHSVVARQFP